MARGPYQGTYVHGRRPTVTHSPDALVFINGEPDILGCGECRRRFDWNRYITSIQVDLNVDSCPGSASINMSVPRHSVDDFYFDGQPLLTPMMEVEIFAKGYFLLEGLPQYYPIFWGLITEVSDNYSGGEHTFSINCSDILKWWELCKMNVNPSFTQPAGQKGRSIFGNVFFGDNPYDIIWTLAQQSFGDVVVGSGSLVSLNKESTQRSTFQGGLSSIMLYWQDRFSQIRSNLLLYGTSGNVVRGDVLYKAWEKGGKNPKLANFASQAVRKANGGTEGSQTVFDPTDPNVTAFRTQFQQAGQVNFWTSEYQTKLELANSAKECIGYEFFMDVTGDIVFKPPFYNLDILGNKPVSWIQDIDIIDWNLADSEAEVVTQVQMQGSFGGNVDFGFGEEATPFTSVTDYHLLRKYGWRTQTFNSEFMASPLLMFYHGLDILDRFNSRRFRGTINIPMRPELRLGFPIYLAPKDQIWYINGISHNITFGGRAQTTLSLTARRTKFVAPKGIGTIKVTSTKGSGKKTAAEKTAAPAGEGAEVKHLTSRQLQGAQFEANVENAAQIPETNRPDGEPTDQAGDNPYAPVVLRHPKTGRVVGWPNVVMAYTRPFFDPPADSLYKVTGQKKTADKKKRGGVPKVIENFDKKGGKKGRKAVEDALDVAVTALEQDRIREQYLTNRYTYGLNSAGVFTYLHDTSFNNQGAIQEMLLLPASSITYKGADIPIIDEETGKQKTKRIRGKDVPLFKNKFTGSSGMIRPVSDERGFEVVGHWRYGRGVSLRDGSLVLDTTNPNSTKNKRVFVQTQLALAGGLVDMLRAQSSGLSTISTPYKDPAYAIANLAPEDLQTAGVINPDTKQPEFATAKQNYIDTAPLGTPKQEGVVVPGTGNVEATQLSRALTLAEMSVREETQLLGRKDCGCLLGRPDLAFINVGYQVQTLRATAPDNTTQDPIGFGALGVSNEDLATLQTAAQNASQTQDDANNLFNDPAVIEATQIAQQQALAAEDVNTATGVVEGAHLTPESAQAINELAASLASGEQGRPVANGTAALTIENLTSTVEAYLTTLYSALDVPHQEYEAAIRGTTVTMNNPTDVPPDQVRFPGPRNQGGFEPPFSAPNRASGGDPTALGLQGQSAVQDIEQQWNSFGDKLEAQAKRSRLEGEINQLNRQINDLLNEAAALGAQFDPDGNPPLSVTVGGPSAADRLNEIATELDRLFQERDNKQQELNILNQEFPC